MTILHRYALSLAFTRWAMLLFLGLFLIHVGDFVAMSGDYVDALGAGRAGDLAAYFALRFPRFMAIWLPVSVAAAALLTAWPMIRQGTLVALCAAGIPVRRVFTSLLALALGVGLLGFALQDQVIPRVDPEAQYARARMLGKLELGQSVSRTLGWHDAGLFWCAQRAFPEEGRYERVAVFGNGEAHHQRAAVMADALMWKEGGWWLKRPVVVGSYHLPVTIREECPVGDVGLRLSVDRDTLVERVKQDRHRTSDQLFAVRSDNALGHVLLRGCFGLLPLLCLLFALPGFIRLEGRNNLGLALGRSAAWMLVPLLGYWMLSRILISNSTHVFIGTTLVLGGLLAVGLWRWWTMRV